MRQVAVIGLGSFGSAVARTLTRHGVEVLAVDIDREKVEDIKDSVAVAVTLDSMDEKALRAVGIDQADAAIVCIGENVEANLLSTTLLKKIGVRAIYSRSVDPLQEEILRALDITNIINIEKEMGESIGKSLTSPNIVMSMKLSSGHTMAEINIPRQFYGKTLKELTLRKRYDVNVVAIKRLVPAIDAHGQRTFVEEINDVPQADDVLTENDRLIVVGKQEHIAVLTTSGNAADA